MLSQVEPADHDFSFSSRTRTLSERAAARASPSRWGPRDAGCGAQRAGKPCDNSPATSRAARADRDGARCHSSRAVGPPHRQHRCELPAEIERVLNARVHAKPAIGRVGMRGIAGKKDAAVHETVRHCPLAHPQGLVLDSEGNIAAHAAAHERGRYPPLEVVGVGPTSCRRHRSLPSTAVRKDQVPSGPTNT